jgi:hypothetical protein
MDTEQRIDRLLDQLEDPMCTEADIARIEAKLKVLRAQQ